MKIFYNVEIQTLGENCIDNSVMEDASRLLRFNKRDIEDEDEYCVRLVYTNSDLSVTEMRERVRALLRLCHSVNYVDVVYRYEGENVPDRFVCWYDGHEQDYTGHIVFTEDE